MEAHLHYIPMSLSVEVIDGSHLRIKDSLDPSILMRPGETPPEHPLDRSQVYDKKNMHTPHRKASSLELNRAAVL